MMSEQIQTNTPQSLNNLITKEMNSKSSASEKREVNELKILTAHGLFYDNLRKAVDRVKKEAVEPFTFSNNFSDNVELRVPTDTDIDIQLSALSQRIQLNKSLLEKANDRIKKINTSEEVSGINQTADFIAPSSESNKVIGALNATLSTISHIKEIISKTSKIFHQD